MSFSFDIHNGSLFIARSGTETSYANEAKILDKGSPIEFREFMYLPFSKQAGDHVRLFKKRWIDKMGPVI